ncbi:MAG: hypothetical protein KC468_38850, partial [Myxococcales bacterium]|nr:hypothetical protein [Myxococcales bacterium]
LVIWNDVRDEDASLLVSGVYVDAARTRGLKPNLEDSLVEQRESGPVTVSLAPELLPEIWRANVALLRSTAPAVRSVARDVAERLRLYRDALRVRAFVLDEKPPQWGVDRDGAQEPSGAKGAAGSDEVVISKAIPRSIVQDLIAQSTGESPEERAWRTVLENAPRGPIPTGKSVVIPASLASTASREITRLLEGGPDYRTKMLERYIENLAPYVVDSGGASPSATPRPASPAESPEQALPPEPRTKAPAAPQLFVRYDFDGGVVVCGETKPHREAIKAARFRGQRPRYSRNMSSRNARKPVADRCNWYIQNTRERHERLEDIQKFASEIKKRAAVEVAVIYDGTDGRFESHSRSAAVPSVSASLEPGLAARYELPDTTTELYKTLTRTALVDRLTLHPPERGGVDGVVLEEYLDAMATVLTQRVSDETFHDPVTSFAYTGRADDDAWLVSRVVYEQHRASPQDVRIARYLEFVLDWEPVTPVSLEGPRGYAFIDTERGRFKRRTNTDVRWSDVEWQELDRDLHSDIEHLEELVARTASSGNGVALIRSMREFANALDLLDRAEDTSVFEPGEVRRVRAPDSEYGQIKEFIRAWLDDRYRVCPPRVELSAADLDVIAEASVPGVFKISHATDWKTGLNYSGKIEGGELIVSRLRGGSAQPDRCNQLPKIGSGEASRYLDRVLDHRGWSGSKSGVRVSPSQLGRIRYDGERIETQQRRATREPWPGVWSKTRSLDPQELSATLLLRAAEASGSGSNLAKEALRGMFAEIDKIDRRARKKPAPRGRQGAALAASSDPVIVTARDVVDTFTAPEESRTSLVRSKARDVLYQLSIAENRSQMQEARARLEDYDRSVRSTDDADDIRSALIQAVRAKEKQLESANRPTNAIPQTLDDVSSRLLLVITRGLAPGQVAKFRTLEGEPDEDVEITCVRAEREAPRALPYTVIFPDDKEILFLRFSSGWTVARIGRVAPENPELVTFLLSDEPTQIATRVAMNLALTQATRHLEEYVFNGYPTIDEFERWFLEQQASSVPLLDVEKSAYRGLLAEATPYSKTGPNYDRNVTDAADWLRRSLDESRGAGETRYNGAKLSRHLARAKQEHRARTRAPSIRWVEARPESGRGEWPVVDVIHNLVSDAAADFHGVLTNTQGDHFVVVRGSVGTAWGALGLVSADTPLPPGVAYLSTTPVPRAATHEVLRAWLKPLVARSNVHPAQGARRVREGEAQQLRAALDAKRGNEGPGGFRYGELFVYEGQSWLVYDFDAKGTGFTLTLVSPDYTHLLGSIDPKAGTRTAKSRKPNNEQLEALLATREDNTIASNLKILRDADARGWLLPMATLLRKRRFKSAGDRAFLASEVGKIRGERSIREGAYPPPPIRGQEYGSDEFKGVLHSILEEPYVACVRAFATKSWPQRFRDLLTQNRVESSRFYHDELRFDSSVERFLREELHEHAKRSVTPEGAKEALAAAIRYTKQEMERMERSLNPLLWTTPADDLQTIADIACPLGSQFAAQLLNRVHKVPWRYGRHGRDDASALCRGDLTVEQLQRSGLEREVAEKADELKTTQTKLAMAERVSRWMDETASTGPLTVRRLVERATQDGVEIERAKATQDGIVGVRLSVDATDASGVVRHRFVGFGDSDESALVDLRHKFLEVLDAGTTELEQSLTEAEAALSDTGVVTEAKVDASGLSILNWSEELIATKGMPASLVFNAEADHGRYRIIRVAAGRDSAFEVLYYHGRERTGRKVGRRGTLDGAKVVAREHHERKSRGSELSSPASKPVSTEANHRAFVRVSKPASRMLDLLVRGLDVGQARSINNAPGAFMAVSVDRLT